MPSYHDPIPDGQTGPWLRGPRHATTEHGQLAFDHRCYYCRQLVWVGQVWTRRIEGKVVTFNEGEAVTA